VKPLTVLLPVTIGLIPKEKRIAFNTILDKDNMIYDIDVYIVLG
jgi:hypothetical protein